MSDQFPFQILPLKKRDKATDPFWKTENELTFVEEAPHRVPDKTRTHELLVNSESRSKEYLIT